MHLNSIFHIFKRFFKNQEVEIVNLVSKHVTLCAKTVEEFDKGLKAILNKNIREFKEHSLNTVKCEEMGDEIRRIIVQEIAKGTLPPLNREDFMRLAGKIDEFADAAKDAIQLLEMVSRNLTEEFKKKLISMSDDVKKCSINLENAVKNLNKDFNKCLEFTHRVSEIEHRIDSKQIECLKELYKLGKKSSDLLLWNEIIERMEEIADICEDASDILRIIITRGL